MQLPEMNSNTISTIYLPDSNKVCLLMWCVRIGVNKQLDLMCVCVCVYCEKERKRKRERESNSLLLISSSSFFLLLYLLLWHCCIHFRNTIILDVLCGSETKKQELKKSAYILQSSGTCDTMLRLYIQSISSQSIAQSSSNDNFV